MPKSFTIGEVLATIRNKLHITPQQGIVLLADGKYILKNGSILAEVYEQHRDEDGFLYLIYTDENIYG